MATPKNINQVYTAAPITTNLGTDLMYFGRSPYGLTDDTAMLFSSFAAQFALASQGIINVNQNSASATLAASRRYNCNNGAVLITFTLPAVAAIGDTFIIVGGSSGGWTIVEAAGQIINLGNTPTTITTGSLSSTNRYDAVTITCITANTTFAAYGLMGNLTVV